MAQKHKKKAIQPQLSPAKLIKERGRTYPLHECHINRHWKQEGIAQIDVVRKMGGDKYLFGSYLVDIFCLGIKDVFVKIVDEQEMKAIQKQIDFDKINCDFTLAQNVIYGAMEYAEDLGFKPHPDFGLAKYMLEDIEDIEYMEIEFGKNGMPLFIQGPDDKSLHIIATLDKNVGAGNYHYIRHLDDEFDEDDEFDPREDDFDKHEEGLTEEHAVNYRFAYFVATVMDKLEHLHELDYEEIAEDIRYDGFIKLRHELAENFRKQGDTKGAMEMEKDEAILGIFEAISQSLLDGVVEYDEDFGELLESFRDVAIYYYSVNVKTGYKKEAKQDVKAENGYVAFEEI